MPVFAQAVAGILGKGRVKREMRKTAAFFTVGNVAAWWVMTLLDYLEEIENINLDQTPAALFFWAAPAIMILAYIIFLRKVGYRENTALPDAASGEPGWKPLDEKGWKYKVLTKLMWLGICAVFTFVITILVCMNLWIVPQAQGGWENFLNGIEYPIFGFLFTLICLAGFVIYDVAAGLIRRHRR